MGRCLYPNLILDGKFYGGVKKYVTTLSNGEPANKAQQQRREAGLKELLKADRAQLVPCGKCLGCRIAYSQNWATRIALELKNHEHSWFATLTYDEEHVPVIDATTGEIYRGIRRPFEYLAEGKTIERMTLRKPDIQKFHKRLRKQAAKEGYMDEGESSIRLFYCGEYGGKSFRPHYHAIYSGFQIPDLQFYKTDHGNFLWKSDWMQKLWGNGIVVIGEATYNSAGYVARYATKKQLDAGKRHSEDEPEGPSLKELYQQAKLVPEFIAMSRRPGIGKRWYDENKNSIYPEGKIYLPGGVEATPPKYYDQLSLKYKQIIPLKKVYIPVEKEESLIE